MKKMTHSIWLTILLCMAFAGSALATTITVEVTGIVDRVQTEDNFALDGSVSIGTAMAGYYTYDSETPDLDSSTNDGSYELISISMIIGNYTFTHDPISLQSAGIGVRLGDFSYNAGTSYPVFDGTIMVDGLPKTYDEITWGDTIGYKGLTVMKLVPSSPGIILDDSLPTSFPDLSVFDLATIFGVYFHGPSFGDGFFEISGDLTSLTVIPEPATLLLFGLGAVILRKRK